MHADQPEQMTLSRTLARRRSLLGAVGALALAAALAIPALASAASLDVDGEATFEAGATTYTVAGATLDASGFVVIHEGTETEIGDVIGTSALLAAGSHSDVTVDLDRAIQDGEYLWVVAHADTNGNGTFDGGSVDLSVTDSTNGNLTLTGALQGLLGFPVLQTLAVQAEGAFQGNIAASGISLVTFTGTTLEGLIQAAQAEGLVSVAATVDGDFVMYIVGAPTFVNAQFNTTFSGGLQANTPLAVTR